MKQYLDTLKAIKENGTYKPAARSGMPGTQSLFGHQFRHNLAEGFPLLTTKKMFWKGVVVELLWFLRGDTNIKFLVDQGVNIWNEDAYQYYQKRYKAKGLPPLDIIPFDNFIGRIKANGLYAEDRIPNYSLGDCGHQYGKVWRNFGTDETGMQFGKGVDQIKNLIEGLRKNPESRRHIVTAWDPTHDQDLALTWCHALFQMNCRPLTFNERKSYWFNVNKPNRDVCDSFDGKDKEMLSYLDESNIPKYYLDCQLYQRSADVFLGVPFNIASYALLTEILAKMCNMIPGVFVHSFGDVHIYDTHKDQVDEQLKRTPTKLPTLGIKDWVDGDDQNIWQTYELDTLLALLNPEMVKGLIALGNYNPQESIKAELSTGLEKK